MKNTFHSLLFFTLYASLLISGIILSSQGFSFAKWNDVQSIEHFINAHAFLLGLAGIGLLGASMGYLWLHARIVKLEKIVQLQLTQLAKKPH